MCVGVGGEREGEPRRQRQAGGRRGGGQAEKRQACESRLLADSKTTTTKKNVQTRSYTQAHTRTQWHGETDNGGHNGATTKEGEEGGTSENRARASWRCGVVEGGRRQEGGKRRS